MRYVDNNNNNTIDNSLQRQLLYVRLMYDYCYTVLAIEKIKLLYQGPQPLFLFFSFLIHQHRALSITNQPKTSYSLYVTPKKHLQAEKCALHVYKYVQSSTEQFFFLHQRYNMPLHTSTSFELWVIFFFFNFVSYCLRKLLISSSRHFVFYTVYKNDCCRGDDYILHCRCTCVYIYIIIVDI